MKKILLAIVLAVFLAYVAVTPAGAVSFDFESFSASKEGVALDGQGGFYLPPHPLPSSASWHYNVHPYADNQPFNVLDTTSTYAVPNNPYGGSNFVAAPGVGDGIYWDGSSIYYRNNRAQHDTSFAGVSIWTISYDFLAGFDDVSGLGQTQNIGSFSTRTIGGTTSYINLMAWDSSLTAFDSSYMAYDAAGFFALSPGVSPGSAWEDLSLDQWYRAWTTFDLTSNRITEVGIIDLLTSSSASYNPTDWYLAGGQAGGPAPEAFRLFTGGGYPGNLLAFDNISITPIPEPATMLLLGSGLVGLAGLSRKKFKK
jgi:hypothetical protein